MSFARIQKSYVHSHVRILNYSSSLFHYLLLWKTLPPLPPRGGPPLPLAAAADKKAIKNNITMHGYFRETNENNIVLSTSFWKTEK